MDGEGDGVLQPSNTQHHPILDVPNWIGYKRTLKIHPLKSGRLSYLIFIMLYKKKNELFEYECTRASDSNTVSFIEFKVNVSFTCKNKNFDLLCMRSIEYKQPQTGSYLYYIKRICQIQFLKKKNRITK